MNRISIFLLLLLRFGDLHAQFVFERQTISCMAVSACDEICINSTAGQIDFGTLTNNQNIVTSGFEQNDGAPAMYVEISVLKDACSGAYEARITNTFGCADADTVSFFWNELPSGDITQLTGPLHVLRAATNTGCVFERSFDFEAIEITEKPCGLVFHNFCSPNGDGDNDYWNVEHADAEQFAGNEVYILNRWGAEVFHVQNYDNASRRWEGKDSSGQPLPDGTYFYSMRVDNKEYKGYIELVR